LNAYVAGHVWQQSCDGSLTEVPTNQQVSIQIIRSVPEIEGIRRIWTRWHHHPNSDVDFYLHILRSRPEILRPHIIVIYRGGQPEAMLVGRLERRHIECRIGYKVVLRLQAAALSFIYA